MLEIVIWISPNDIDDLEKTLKRLVLAKDFISEEWRKKIKFNICMCISNEIIDRSKSQKGIMEESTEKFIGLNNLIGWATGDLYVSIDVHGCTSMRRIAAKSNSNWYLWLDTDIIYDPRILSIMIDSIESLEKAGYSKFVISPEIVRIWDNTWDCLVNERFINKPLGYEKTNNPYNDVIIGDDVAPELEEVRNTIPGQPYMKFAGGWFVVVSKELLKEIPFPENYGHYGLDDTYLMWMAHVKQSPEIKQFKIKNIVVCENYYDRIISYKDKIHFIDRRDEYKKYNESILISEIEKYNRDKQLQFLADQAQELNLGYE